MSSNLRLPSILTNHLGFLCDARKRIVVESATATGFEIQNMGCNAAEELGKRESWVPVFRGELTESRTPMGNYRIGDFSAFSKPGIYRAVLIGDEGHSYQFMIGDGAFSTLPRLFLSYINAQRSGGFQNAWRGPSHLDDGIRSDTKEPMDAVGGWYDAGDLRKTMTTTFLPSLGFSFFARQPECQTGAFNPWLDEMAWAMRFILKMQDPATGMIYEDVGSGSTARMREGMTWWYENHSGCCVDNSQNRFTDNVPGSGDEREVRIQYNPIVQYTIITVLLNAATALAASDPDLAEKCRTAATRCWFFVDSKKDSDPLHEWTSIRSWRLLAGIELARAEIVPWTIPSHMAEELMELYSSQIHFWFNDTGREAFYRGILHSAQPLIALGTYAALRPDEAVAQKAKMLLADCWEHYVRPMSATNPFGIIPYGLYHQKETPHDNYREWSEGVWFRFFMPLHTPQKINHGLGSHWTSWAHALSVLAGVLDCKEIRDAAWDQLHWLWGGNPLRSCLVSGVGYNSPMPHSRFLGFIPGGCFNGPCGTVEDTIHIDLEGHAEWNSTEYWNVPLANAMLAIAHLTPAPQPKNLLGLS